MTASAGLPSWALRALVCPVCRDPMELEPEGADSRQGLLRHADGALCGEFYPVIDGIPRLVVGGHRAEVIRAKREWFGATPTGRAIAARWGAEAPRAGDPIVAGFDDEWSRHDAVGTSELAEIFELYFDLVPPSAFRPDLVVLDAACGAGRWAYEVARRGNRVIAVDIGFSVEIAARNTASTGRVVCVQADVNDLPFAEASVDWAYSLGVLHHLEAPERALAEIVRCVRPGGHVLVYVYYALDDRGPITRSLFRVINGVRLVTSRLPRPALRIFAALTAVAVYWPLARLAWIVERLGHERASRSIPLAFYRSRSIAVMMNDSLDRFGTRLERRFRRDEVQDLMRRAGLSDVAVSDIAPYWHGVGIRTRAI